MLQVISILAKCHGEDRIACRKVAEPGIQWIPRQSQGTRLLEFSEKCPTSLFLYYDY
jgi:hypothetical protein